jgi:hypothetical protein
VQALRGLRVDPGALGDQQGSVADDVPAGRVAGHQQCDGEVRVGGQGVHPLVGLDGGEDAGPVRLRHARCLQPVHVGAARPEVELEQLDVGIGGQHPGEQVDPVDDQLCPVARIERVVLGDLRHAKAGEPARELGDLLGRAGRQLRTGGYGIAGKHS